MGDESYILWRCPRCGLWKCDPDQMPVHRQECGGEFKELEVVPKARLAEVEQERDNEVEEAEVAVTLWKKERALADELAEALKAAKSAIFSNEPWSATLGKVIGDALAHHRERRERD